ncbi:MAG: hypothetical protein KY476_25345 [Planctomycetes bacterium]|nr:hypothetical protein [Planctomycetota bacterium]
MPYHSTRCRRLVGVIVLVIAARPVAEEPPPTTPPERPVAQDFSAASLKAYERKLLARYGGADREVPLEVKAEHFEWVLRKYMQAPTGLVHHTVVLPNAADGPRNFTFGDDIATWNGALVAALSYKYAVTKDAETLAFIADILRGLHFSQQVTGRDGLIARCVLKSDVPVAGAKRRYVGADGAVYHFRSDPAKGTYNQVAGGYAVLMLLTAQDLPADVRQLACRDLQALAWRLVEDDYRLKDVDGDPTSYGDLTPVFAAQGVPFNAQVAYAVVAAGHHFPGEDLVRAKMIRRAFERLRNKHHVYYEDPRTHLIRPQEVGASPFVKGTNDRAHVLTAAYIGVFLELEYARRNGVPPDREFLYQLGQTMDWTMRHIENDRNALCNLMWAGVLSDPQAFAAILPHPNEQARVRRQIETIGGETVEQLRRLWLDRFYRPGQKIETREPQWAADRKRHDSYLWKSGPFDRWEVTGPATNDLCASMDYLHAYWLMRYWHERRLGP